MHGTDPPGPILHTEPPMLKSITHVLVLYVQNLSRDGCYKGSWCRKYMAVSRLGMFQLSSAAVASVKHADNAFH